MAGLKAWLAAAHPFPLTAVLLLTALVGVASADGEPDAARLALVLLAMALSQLAIGWSNDYLDRETDAVQQPWKPLPSGLIDARSMPRAILAVLAGSLAAGVLLGAAPLALLIGGTACGLVYNLKLKDTPFSAVPFVVGLGLLPLYVWLALDVYEDDFLWLYALGTPLALAAHIANTVPDIETDTVAGRRGLAVLLGRKWSVVLIVICLLLALMLFLNKALSELSDAASDWSWDVLGWVLLPYCVWCLFVAFFYARTESRDGDVWGFRFVALGGVFLATGWLAAV
jgi:4-hydroxybenzoate polyprenyltransferase